MATLNEITHNILNVLSGGRGNQDQEITLRQIAMGVVYYRSLIIRRDLTYWKRMGELEQDLGLISMEIAQEPVGRANEVPHTMLKSSRELPKLLQLRRRIPLTFVGSPDLQETYPITTVGNASNQKYAKYTSSSPRSFLHDGYLYIMGDPVAEMVNNLTTGDTTIEDVDTSEVERGITTIRIKGIFADPRSPWVFTHQKEFDWDIDFPGTPENLIQRITQSILKVEGSITKQMPLDTELDRLPVNQQPQDNEEQPA